MTITYKTADPVTGLFANSEGVLKVIAHSQDPSVPEMQRRTSIGILRGYRTFYRVDGKPKAVEYLTMEIKKAEGLL